MAAGALEMDTGNLSPGDVGGVFAGLVGLLVAIGKGFAWLANWKNTRENTRAARLRAWEAALDKRDREMRVELEQHVHAVEKKLSAVTMVMFEMLGELQRLDPVNPVLARARVVLNQTYPVDPDIPEEMRTLIRRVEVEIEKKP